MLTISYSLDLGHFFHSLVIYTFNCYSFIFLVKDPNNILMTKKKFPSQSVCLDEASHLCKLYWGQKIMKIFNNIENLLTIIREMDFSTRYFSLISIATKLQCQSHEELKAVVFSQLYLSLHSFISLWTLIPTRWNAMQM